MATDIQSLQHATALHPNHYLASADYRFDMAEIIAAHWQCIAPASAVAEPGDVIVRDIAGAPILVTHTQKGELKGFYNVCAHRAGPLASCDQKGLNRLRCQYHGWTYSLDGQLKTAPEMREAEGFDTRSVALTPVDVLAWGGMIFARLKDGPSFSALFDGITDIASETMLSHMVHTAARRYEVAANWKIYVDNFLEGYHLPYVHPGLTQLVDYGEYTTENGRYWSLQRSPVEESDPYAAGEGLYFFIYPNTMLNIMPGRLQSNRVVPTGIDTCRVEFDFYYAPGPESRRDKDLRFSDQVQEEDRTVCEHIQKAMMSGAYSPARLSPKREANVWHWHNLLREAYAQRDAAS